MRGFAHEARWLSLGLCSVLVMLLGLSLAGGRVFALWGEAIDQGTPGYVTLRSNPALPEWRDLHPGESVIWQVEASLADARESTLALELVASGELVKAGEMTAGITTCDASACGTPTVIREVAALPELGPENFRLATLEASTPRLITVTLTYLPQADTQEGGGSARIGLGVHATGETLNDEMPTEPGGAHTLPGELPVTGADITALVLTGVGLVGLGGALLLRRRARGAGKLS